MNHILPINYNLPVHGRCWDSIRLVAIMSDERNIPWFLDKFLSIYMNSEFFLIDSYNLYSLERMSIYDEVLEYHKITEVSSDNLIEKIIHEIDSNRYILSIYDSYYIENSNNYHKNHRIHDILVYGYDSENEFIYYYDVPEDKYADHITLMKFSQYRESFFPV